MGRTPHDLLVARHKPYRQAFERAQRAGEASQRAQERVQELETRLAAHELSPGEAEKLRQVVAKAKAEHESAVYATSCANQELDRMPAERRGDWLRRAQADFQARRATYEQLIGDLAEAREQLAQEAALIDACSASRPYA